MDEFTIKTSDGLNLHALVRRPKEDPKACISMVHGIGEHIGRHEVIANHFNESGYATLQFDLRGHGKSEGKRGHSPSYDRLLDDIALLLYDAAIKFPKLPHILFGHSMGGALVINYCLKRKPDLTGVISVSPGFRTTAPTPGWKISMVRIFSTVWPAMTLYNGVKAEDLTRDTEIVRLTLEDPLYHFRISARMGLDVITEGEWAIENASEWEQPLLLMHGTGDRLTSHEASREFASKAGDNCTFRLWDNLYHEMHNDPEGNEVLAYIVEWLKKRATVS